jgi:S1-C subfamily serine protease
VVSGTSGSSEELQELDTITYLNQKRVSSIIDIHRYLRTVRIGGDLTLGIVRAGAPFTIRIKALELPESVGSNP